MLVWAHMGQQKQKVFVGMSGGVDSSVSAALLLEQNYEVVGVFIKVWQADFLPCTWREERREAMRAAAHLEIPFLTLDLEKEYKEEVVDYMIREYGAGRVPNPDVMCNKHVKFGAFLDFAKKNGADCIATGHYARITHVQSPSLYTLLAGTDKEKDQSYFLWTLAQAQLQHTLFPVGHLKKPDVRALAKKFGLPNAEKKDSQGLCFMGAVDMKEFLKHYLDTKPGKVLGAGGTVMGEHDGAMLYTIGQRHGFHTTKHTADADPLFVLSKDIAANTITVGNHAESVSAGAHEVTVDEINDPSLTLRRASASGEIISARIRYRGGLFDTQVHLTTATTARIVFSQPVEDIATGQSIVFYLGDACVGGGVIAHVRART